MEGVALRPGWASAQNQDGRISLFPENGHLPEQENARLQENQTCSDTGYCFTTILEYVACLEFTTIRYTPEGTGFPASETPSQTKV
jgi:hypothetical protein